MRMPAGEWRTQHSGARRDPGYHTLCFQSLGECISNGQGGAGGWNAAERNLGTWGGACEGGKFGRSPAEVLGQVTAQPPPWGCEGSLRHGRTTSNGDAAWPRHEVDTGGAHEPDRTIGVMQWTLFRPRDALGGRDLAEIILAGHVRRPPPSAVARGTRASPSVLRRCGAAALNSTLWWRGPPNALVICCGAGHGR